MLHRGEQPRNAPSWCLLCIRRDIGACFLAYKSIMINPQRQIDRPTFVLPPFTNLCDVPGGYNTSAMGVTPCEFTPMPVYVCGVSGTLCAHYDPATKRWFVDQGSVVYTGNAANPQDF